MSNRRYVGRAQAYAAARDNYLVVLDYTDADGNSSTRLVEIYEDKHGGVYAWCLTRDAIRKFRNDRINGYYITNQKFKPRFPVKV